MSKNKIIFAILWVILFVLLMLLALNLRSWARPQVGSWDGNLKIWILQDDVTQFQEYLNSFKAANPKFANKQFVVESFSDELSYNNAVVSATLAGEWPDLFMINNSETSILENLALGIDPSKVSPNDFRLRFKPVFGEDMIVKDSTDETIEFLKWVPLWYEALGIFYNRKYFLRPSELKTWTDFSKEVRSIANKYSKIVPIALWNGTWVSRSADILRTFLVLEWNNSLVNTWDTRQVLATLNEFWAANGDNGYNNLSAPFIDETDIDFFTQGDVAAMVWYPRDLWAINDIWYQKGFLFATPFPWYAGKEKEVAINYNYFAINKNTKLPNSAHELLAYMSSKAGQQAYVDVFPFYLSPESSVELGMLEKKILPEYNIVYKNFITEDTQLVSYDSWNKYLFDMEVKNILDMKSGYDKRFSDMRSFVVCSVTKQETLLNLSSPCK